MRLRLGVFLGFLTMLWVGFAGAALPAGAGPPPSLELTKTGPSLTAPGGVLMYSLVVTNPGPSTLTDVELVDQLADPGTSNEAIEVQFDDTWDCQTDSTNLRVTCTIASLPPGTSEFDIVAFASNDVQVGQELVNQAQVSATAVSPVSAQVSTTVIGDTPLTVAATGPALTLAPGTVTYDVAVNNTGALPALFPNLDIDFPDSLEPHNQQIAPPGWNCGFTPFGEYACIGAQQIAAGETAAFQLAFDVATGTAPGTALTTTFAALAENSARVEAPVTTTVVGPTTLAIVKRAPSDVIAGAPLRYEIEVTNPGPWAALQPAIHDTLPPGFALESVEASPPWTCESGEPEHAVECTADVLAAGASTRIALVGRVHADQGGVLRNRAETHAANADEAGAAVETRVVAVPVAPAPPAPVVPVTVARAGGGSIPATGATSVPFALFGAGLVVLGGALVATARVRGHLRGRMVR